MEVGARWRDDKHGIREGNNRELDGTRRGSDSGHHLANGKHRVIQQSNWVIQQIVQRVIQHPPPDRLIDSGVK